MPPISIGGGEVGAEEGVKGKNLKKYKKNYVDMYINGWVWNKGRTLSHTLLILDYV